MISETANQAPTYLTFVFTLVKGKKVKVRTLDTAPLREPPPPNDAPLSVINHSVSLSVIGPSVTIWYCIETNYISSTLVYRVVGQTSYF